MTIFAALPVLALVLRTPAHPTTRAPAPAMQLEALDVVQTGGAAVLAAFTFKEVSSWSKATGELKKVILPPPPPAVRASHSVRQSASDDCELYCALQRPLLVLPRTRTHS